MIHLAFLLASPVALGKLLLWVWRGARRRMIARGSEKANDRARREYAEWQARREG